MSDDDKYTANYISDDAAIRDSPFDWQYNYRSINSDDQTACSIVNYSKQFYFEKQMTDLKEAANPSNIFQANKTLDLEENKLYSKLEAFKNENE